ncbi:NaeI family type II restriction endonuclease [Brevundimonas sp. TWP2-3-2]|uniref:NaeI family type II restriction endonuclease n=1 Tax=unclassified Brevundimonas TaxID=2622653 RepID=UPI003CE9DE0E
MSKLTPSAVGPDHVDYDVLKLIADAIAVATRKRPREAFSLLTLEAIEFVLDPVRTGRTTLSELDNVEKTFIGLKIEHFLRDMLDAPKGVRDLVIAGYDVDVKNTVSTPWAWMIPPETFRNEEPVVLIAANETERKAWMGLMIARDSYLGKPNRDGKRGILTPAYANILWIAPDDVTP